VTGGESAAANENKRNCCGDRERFAHHLRPFISLCRCCVELNESAIRACSELPRQASEIFPKLPDSNIRTRPFRRVNPSNYISSLQKAVS
jgi:hypothetical protein